MNATPDKDDFNLVEFADALRRLDPRDLKLIRLISHRLASVRAV